MSARGAVACGHPLAAEVGASVLRAGGNAVDAAVASLLTSCAVEPGLTGLGAGGLALIRFGSEVVFCDMFGTVPGLSDPSKPLQMDRVVIDFGTATQVFHVGPASVSTPGVAAGICALHRRWGRIPLPELAAPAARAAREGVPLEGMMSRSLGLLWPILKRYPGIQRLYSNPDGTPLKEGDCMKNLPLGDTLERLGREGSDFLYRGDGAAAAVRALGGESALGMEDLAAYHVRFTKPVPVSFRGATVYLPGRPSVAGLMVRAMLGLIEEGGPMPGDRGPDEVERVLSAQGVVDRNRGEVFLQSFFEDGFDQRFLAACRAGFTTHLSAVDADGNAVALTSSLGETAGVVVPETGVVLNNFLGEADVNPPSAPRPVGERLFTMCCPVIAAGPGGVDVMGSGGSSRIPSILLCSLLERLEHRRSLAEVVRAPRVHLEGHTFARLEEHGRPPGVADALRERGWTVDVMPKDNLYFGGLNAASWALEGCEGAGDPRRFGAAAS